MNCTLTKEDAINDLKEVLAEIQRLNRLSGETVFNPAATDCLREVMEWIKEEA